MNDESPYIRTEKVFVEYKYNPNYGDDRICECGHEYHRHFDSHENMDAVGCKYCQCRKFKDVESLKKALEKIKALSILQAEKLKILDELKILIAFVEMNINKEEEPDEN